MNDDSPQGKAPHSLRSGARTQIMEDAEKMGITPAFISTLVETFYKRIRKDAVLAPLFDSRIAHNDWPDHLIKMKRFWASVILNAGIYTGKPMVAHAQITQLEEDHFEHWLALFEETLRDIAPSDEVKNLFLHKAIRISDSLRLGLFRYRDTKSTAANDSQSVE